MIGTITLEPVVPAHAELLYDIFKDIHPELTGLAGLPGDQLEGILRLQYDIRQEQLNKLYPNAERNLILLDGVPAGYICTDSGSDIRIVEIGLYESCRGNGLGSRVVGNIIEAAKAQGRNVLLQVLWCNDAAYRFYIKMGFSVVGSNDVTYEMIYRCNSNHEEDNIRS